MTTDKERIIELENKLCRARDYLTTIKASVENVAGAFIGYIDIDTMINNLHESSPCAHAKEADRLREAVENAPRWSMREVDSEDEPLYDGMETDDNGDWINRAELHHRAGGVG